MSPTGVNSAILFVVLDAFQNIALKIKGGLPQRSKPPQSLTQTLCAVPLTSKGWVEHSKRWQHIVTNHLLVLVTVSVLADADREPVLGCCDSVS